MSRLQSLFQAERVNVAERFELMREAISGTMSNFYMARDRTSNQIVGLKLGNKEKVLAFEARFKGLKKPTEGEIAKSMHHPLIVATYEYGLTTDDLPYIVMEYVKGPGLHLVLFNRDGTLDGIRWRIVRQMAEAVEYVHSAGYIHRDVCPRNFIYQPDVHEIKLIDFGLTLPAKKEFMQPGNRTGTPLYMAPEVVRRRWTDQRLDIFALGVSAYQVCTETFPWPVLETSGQAALAHDTVEPTDILDRRPRLNPMLARAIMRCVAPDPKDRPQSVDRFLAMIRDVASDEE